MHSRTKGNSKTGEQEQDWATDTDTFINAHQKCYFSVLAHFKGKPKKG